MASAGSGPQGQSLSLLLPMLSTFLEMILPRRRLLIVLAVGWMAVIFLLSAQTTLQLPHRLFHQDKALHALLFGVLGFLWALLVMRDAAPPTLGHALVVTLLVMGYGGLDEYHQSFVPGRTPDILDLAADTAGGLLSASLVLFMLRRGLRQGGYRQRNT